MSLFKRQYDKGQILHMVALLLESAIRIIGVELIVENFEGPLGDQQQRITMQIRIIRYSTNESEKIASDLLMEPPHL